jgi:hypothetical protein
MSWNGALSNPNWGGNNSSTGGGGGGGGGSDVGNLYTTPNPPTIQENPSIGLIGRNEIPLPTKYKDFDVKNLTCETFNKVPADITQWSLYPAISNVNANLDVTGNKQFDLNNFREVNCGTLNAQQGVGPAPAGGIVNAAVSVNAPLGAFDIAEIGTCNVNDFLVVEGGTTLDGGVTHGTTIGSLPVAGVNTIRLDVLPVGIDMVSATYITMNAAAAGNFAAGGAMSVAAGGALSLAGGSYIEYNTDENRFINTSAGNDFTDIKVGNIFPAYGGSANLRINGGGSGRGVEIADGTTITTDTLNGDTLNGDVVNGETINLPVYLDYQTWSPTIQYAPTNEVQYINSVYTTTFDNLGVQPASASFPAWDPAESYNLWRYVLYSGVNYVCIAPVLSATTPDVDTTHWQITTRTAPQIWTQTDTLLKNYIAFTNDYAGATNYTTLLVPYATTDNLSVLVRNIATNNEVSRGAVYTELNPPPLPSIATTNLDMDGYNINNADEVNATTLNATTLNVPTGNIDVVNIPQMEMSPTWSAASSYNTGDRVIRGTNVYVAVLLNRDLDPELVSVPFWQSSTPYGLNDIRTIGSGFNYRCILGYAGGTTSPNSDPTHWVNVASGNVDQFWTFSTTLTNGSITFPAIAGDTKYFQLAKKTGSDGLYIVERDSITNEIEAFGRIYDTAVYPPPPFDPSINTDLDLNNNNINNVNSIFATNTYTYNIGSKNGVADINLLQDLVGTGRSIKDFSTITLKTGVSSGGLLQLKNAAGTILSEYYVNNGSGNTILSATNQLDIFATGGVFIDTSLTLPTITTGEIGGTAGGPITLLTGINANNESITNINQLTTDILGGVGGPLMMQSNIDMNGYEITGLDNLVVGELDAPLIKVDTIRPLTNNGVLIQNFVDVKTTSSSIPSCINIRRSNSVSCLRLGSDDDTLTGGSLTSVGILLLNGNGGTHMQSEADCIVAATTTTYIQANDGIEFNTGNENVVSKSNVVIDKNDPVFSLTHLSSANELKMENTGAATSITSDLPLTINGASSISITADTEDINITSTTGSTNIGGTEVNIDSGSINITASASDVNISSTTGVVNVEDIIVSGAEITNIDYASMFYARFGIPDTSNFAWFRWWVNDEFSYSLDEGVNWIPISYNWSKHPAIQNVEVGGYDITGVNQINVDKVVGNTGTDVSFETNSLTNVDRVNDYAIFKWGDFVNENVVNISAANTINEIKFPLDIQTSDGFTLNGSDQLVADARGTYRIIVTLHPRKNTGGNAKIDSWFRVNGTDVEYSNNQYHFSTNGERELLMYSRIIRLNAGDIISVMWASSNANVFLSPDAIQTTPFAHPESPSALISIVCV